MRHFLVVVSCLLLSVFPMPGADIAGTFSTDTTLVNGDTWTGGDVTINTGILVNIPTGAVVTFNSTGGSAGRNLNGAGTLQIDEGGRLLLDTASANDNIIFTGSAKMINAGVLQIDCGADLRLSGTGSSFTNNGLIHKTQGSDGSANDPSYFFPSSSSAGGTFVNNGDIQVDAGHLNISGTPTAAGAATSNGGDFTVANGATLSFTGGWSLLRGVSAMTGTGLVALTNEDAATTTGGIFSAEAATTILDITGDGLRWTTGILDGNGNTLRNDGLLRLTGTAAGARVQGTGSVENGSDGEFRLESGTLTLTAANFTNRGSMTLQGTTTATTVTLSGTGTLINASGGTFTLTQGNLTTDANIQNDGTVVMNSTGTIILGGTGTLTTTTGGLMTFNRGTLSLNGNQVINNGTAQFIDGSNATLAGTGRFINNGTFNHIQNGGNDNFILSNSVVFENTGTYDLQGGGDLQFFNTSVFENKGVLKKTSSTGDASFVFGVGKFTAAAGSEIQATAGTLRLASGGTSVETATWTANGGVLDIAGEWSGIIKGSSTSSFRITNSANGSVASDLSIGTGGLTFNISGNGIVWSQQTILTQGNNLTNSGIFGITVGGTKTLSGGGEFINAAGGIFNHTDGLLTLADNSTFRNQGTWNLLTGSGDSSYEGTGSFINDSTGTVDWSGGGLGITSTVLFRNDGIFNITGTGTRSLKDGGQLLNGSTGSFNWDVATTLSIAADTRLRNEGTFNINGTGTRALTGAGQWLNAATGTVEWNDTATLSLASGLSVVNDGIVNINGDGNRILSGTGTFTNNGTFNLAPSTTNDNITGANSGGQFINNGTFIFANIGDFDLRDGYTFTNAPGGLIQKQATNTSTDQAQFFSFSSDVGAGTFDNQGTVEVLGGNFRVTSSASGTFDDLTFVQSDGAGTLTGGTWIANATQTGLATIDLDAFGNSTGIQRIGEDATVELIGTGASLFQISSMTQLDGTLYIQQQTFTPSAAFQVNATGTLGGNGTLGRAITVAGTVLPGGTRGTAIGTLTVNSTASFLADALIQVQLQGALAFIDHTQDQATRNLAILALGDLDPSGTQHDSLEVTGTLTFAPATRVEVIPAGITYQSGMVFDLFDFAGLGIAGVTQVDAPGILELPDISGFGLDWDTSLFVSHGIIYVIPEPSRLMLLAAGLSLLLMRRRRV